VKTFKKEKESHSRRKWGSGKKFQREKEKERWGKVQPVWSKKQVSEIELLQGSIIWATGGEVENQEKSKRGAKSANDRSNLTAETGGQKEKSVD